MAQSAVTEFLPKTKTGSGAAGLRVILVLPGATDLDTQGRIKGSLDVPLNEQGDRQSRELAAELDHEPVETVYCSPGLAARQMARMMRGTKRKARVLENLRNMNRGLWHGKRVTELRESQPRLYRKWIEEPETVCPPGGETINDARQRLRRALERIRRKHKRGTVAVVVSEPAASIVRQLLSGTGSLGDLWQAECRCGSWESFDLAASSS